MIRLLITHFSSSIFFGRAADVLLGAAVDPRLRHALATARSESLLYPKRSLLTRLGGDKTGKRAALVDKERCDKLRRLLA